MTTDDEISRRCEESCIAQGVPVAIADPVVIARVVQILKPKASRPRAAA